MLKRLTWDWIAIRIQFRQGAHFLLQRSRIETDNLFVTYFNFYGCFCNQWDILHVYVFLK